MFHLLFLLQEALDMALPANQLAGRIPDSYIHMWAASLLRGQKTILTPMREGRGGEILTLRLTVRNVMG